MLTILKTSFILLVAATPLYAKLYHGIAVHEHLKYDNTATHFEYTNPDAPKGGTLKLGEAGKVDSLNPYILKGDSTPMLKDFVYASLMKRAKDEPFTMYAYIAESVEMPEDRSHIIFNLRDSARFHDGSHITADDVVFSFNLIKTKGNPRYRMSYKLAEKVEKLSPKRIKITFDKTRSDKESPLLISMMPILSKTYYEKINFAESTLKNPMSAGPYTVKSFEPGKKLTLERIKDHWSENIFVGKGMNNFEQVSISYFRDENVLLENFLNGGLDFLQETDFARWQKAYTIPAVKTGKIIKLTEKHGRPFGMFGIALNSRKELFQDHRVRKALISLMDQDFLNKNYYYGFYKPITGFFNNSALGSQGPANKQETDIINACSVSSDPDCFSANTHLALSPRTRLRKALHLLKEAGWTMKDQHLVKAGVPFQFELLIAEKPHEKIALAYADMLKKAGITLKVRFVDSAQYNARKSDFDFDSVIHLWGVSASPGIEQNLFWSSKAADNKGTRNYANIKDKRVDEIIQKMLQEKTRQGYLHYVRALDRILWSQQAIIPLVYWNKDLLAYSHKLEKPVYNKRTKATLNYLFQPHRVIETWWERQPNDE